MRAASKTLKRHSYVRRYFQLKNGGFTIIETLIVLAVTGLLFVMAAIQVSGRQNETEFQQAINDVNSTLQKEINGTTTGDYQGNQQIQCDRNGQLHSGRPTPNVSLYSGTNPDNLGTSGDCVFLGKVVQFYNGTGRNNQQYWTYPVTGLRNDVSGNECAIITCVEPKVIAPDDGHASIANGIIPPYTNTFPDLGQQNYLNFGLKMVYMHYVQPTTTTNVGAFGILSSLGTTPGSQQFYLIPVKWGSYSVNPTNATNRSDAVSNINYALQNSYSTATGFVASGSTYSLQICMKSGTTKQSGKITIGGSGGNLNSVQTTIYSNTTCT